MMIYFDLTDKQIKKIHPLQKQVEKAAAEGPTKRGMILAQIVNYQLGAKFIKAETANKIIAILKEAGYGD